MNPVRNRFNHELLTKGTAMTRIESRLTGFAGPAELFTTEVRAAFSSPHLQGGSS
jgi:hypothetical protein